MNMDSATWRNTKVTPRWRCDTKMMSFNAHFILTRMEKLTMASNKLKCDHAFCINLHKLKEKRDEKLEERKKMKEQSLRTSHYMVGTESNAYYTCQFCLCKIKKSYFTYIQHCKVCPKK